MLEPVRFTIHAYLSARDQTSQNFTTAVRTTLRDFKTTAAGKQSEVFMAYDDQRDQISTIAGGSGTDPELGFFRINESGDDELCTSAPCPAACETVTYSDGLKRFLVWVEEQRKAKKIADDVPRILIFSNHGTAGFGLSARLVEQATTRIPRDEQDEATRALNDALDEAEEILRADRQIRKDDRSETEVNKRALEERIIRLFRNLERRDISDLIDRSGVDTAYVLIDIRHQPDRLETGITLLAAGKDIEIPDANVAQDRLSVAEFGRVIGGLGLYFDVTILHACAIGLPDTVYELRDVARSVIVCPVRLGTRLSFDQSLLSVSGISRSSTFAEPFFIRATKEIVETERTVGSNTSWVGATTAWTPWEALVSALSAFSEELLQRFGSSECETRDRLWKIRREIKCDQPSANKCACQTYDLVHFSRRVADDFGGEFHELQSRIEWGQNSLMTEFFRIDQIGIDCQTNGFALFFPVQQKYLFDTYHESGAEGFALLGRTRWREVLDLMKLP